MSLFSIHIDRVVVTYDDEKINQILELLILNNKNQKKIMGQLDDLKAESAQLTTKVDDLQVKVDAEQAQVKILLDLATTVKTQLEARIAELEAQLAHAIDPAALQSTIDELKATNTKIDATTADIESTVADTPTDPVDPNLARRRR